MKLPDTPQAYWQRQALIEASGAEATPLQYDQMLEAYYRNNGLYQAVQLELYENGIWTPAMIGLRNPAHRAVEFHVSHIWPGTLGKDLQIISDNKSLPDAVATIWKWSNWGAKKQVASRWFALFGSWFCKVSTRNETVTGTDGNPTQRAKSVYLKNIKPCYVVDFDMDERDFLTYIRIDVPYIVRDGNTVKSSMRTEIWNKSSGDFTAYNHSRKYGEQITLLGDPTDKQPLSNFGIDFLPFVHAKFIDDGEKRGVNAFAHVLDKIDEANRMATRLHQILFRYNKPTTAVMANGTDPSGRPLPPPRMDDNDNDTVTEADGDIRRFPGMSKMEYLVPNLNYDSYLKAIDAQMTELEQDLPELTYYRLRDMGANLSGKAVRLLLSQAIDRVLEARGNIEPALARANAMALTIASNSNLPGFENIGKYENGDFEHTFAPRPVIAESDAEQADTIKAETGAGIPLITSVRRRGWTDTQIADMGKDMDAASKKQSMNLAQAMLEAERQATQNDQVVP